jgi:hypothetical protein
MFLKTALFNIPGHPILERAIQNFAHYYQESDKAYFLQCLTLFSSGFLLLFIVSLFSVPKFLAYGQGNKNIFTNFDEDKILCKAFGFMAFML